MEIEHFLNVGGVYAKKCTFKRGESAPMHRHTFAHLSVVASGFFRIEREGEPAVDLGPGACYEVPAETSHRVHALTPGTWLCIHRSDIDDPDLIDETLTSTK
jgi:quercetin dioxygenase-like cupin family protein